MHRTKLPAVSEKIRYGNTDVRLSSGVLLPNIEREYHFNGKCAQNQMPSS